MYKRQVRGGIVPGGGALEIACAREVEKLRASQRGMQAYGLLCVVEALKRPLSQIVSNAGFNPLEKVGDVTARQTEEGNDNLAVDCETGEIKDMLELGVIDPAPVKSYALKAAMEIDVYKRQGLQSICKRTDDRRENLSTRIGHIGVFVPLENPRRSVFA